MLTHTVGFLAIALAIIYPQSANAGVFSSFTEKVKAVFLGSQAIMADDTASSQGMPAFKPVVVHDEEIDTLDSTANGSLSATTGSLRVSTEDIDYPTDSTISVYEVKKGDTLATVAKLFGVSKNTIVWANDLKSERISPGDTLVILPVTGVKHTVKNGDTITSIARKYKGDVEDISKYNGIASDAKLASGDIIIVPEGEITITTTTRSNGKTIVRNKVLDSYKNSAPSGFLARPLVGGMKTQGIHGHNGVDIAGPIGLPIYASANGIVISAKPTGYNGGYGSMVIISHAGNIQTIYAHMSRVDVFAGQAVSQGQVIGALGNTGRSTGPHLHFEVRGAKNPF